MPDHLSRRLLVCVLALAGVALLAAGRANAGYGVAPNGQSFPVTLDSIGYIASPNSIDLVVYLDAQDSDAYVWVSESQGPRDSGANRPAASKRAPRSRCNRLRTLWRKNR